MLVSGYWNDQLRVWNEKKAENVELYRVAQGSDEVRDDIRAIAASEHHSLIATGS